MGIKTRLTKMKKGVVNICKKFKMDKSVIEARRLIAELEEGEEQPAAPKKKFMACGFKKKDKKKNSGVNQPEEESTREIKSRVSESIEATGSTVGTKSSVGTNKSTKLTEEETEAMTKDNNFTVTDDATKEVVMKNVAEVIDIYKETNYHFRDNIILLEKLLNHSMESTKGKGKADDFIAGIRPLLISLFAVARECTTLFFHLNAESEEKKNIAIDNFKVFFFRSIAGVQLISSDLSPTAHQESIFFDIINGISPPPTIRVATPKPTVYNEPEITLYNGNPSVIKKGSSSTNPST
ncbi:hypothetical protein BD770DRAFT_427365 [Pilaira anomala]|nr:hypothetical protein BD770DRAFT_427365 [Pilaira anomala]